MSKKPTYKELKRRVLELEAAEVERNKNRNTSKVIATDQDIIEHIEAQSGLEKIYKIGLLANSSLDLEVVLSVILKSTIETLKGTAGMVYLKDPVTGYLSWKASSGFSEAFLRGRAKNPVQPGEGLSGRIAQTGEPIFIPIDCSHDLRITRLSSETERFNSFLGVPIFVSGDIVGVMNILTHTPDILHEQDQKICSAIGSHVGVAIRNAQLFERQKQAEKSLRESEERFQTITNSVEDSIFCKDLDRKFTFVNPPMLKYFNCSEVDIIGKTNEEFLDKKEDVAKVCNEDQDALNGKGVDKIRTIWISGKPLIFHTIRGPLRDAEGNIIGISGISRDVTELMKAKEKLHRVNDELELRVEERTSELRRNNIAMTEILSKFGDERQNIANKVIANVNTLILPSLNILIEKADSLDKRYLMIIKQNLRDVTSSFGSDLMKMEYPLSPKEAEISLLIKGGFSIKEIATMLNVSDRTVESHRLNIRKKFGITSQKTNLAVYLNHFTSIILEKLDKPVH